MVSVALSTIRGQGASPRLLRPWHWRLCGARGLGRGVWGLVAGAFEGVVLVPGPCCPRVPPESVVVGVPGDAFVQKRVRFDDDGRLPPVQKDGVHLISRRNGIAPGIIEWIFVVITPDHLRNPAGFRLVAKNTLDPVVAVLTLGHNPDFPHGFPLLFVRNRRPDDPSGQFLAP